MTRRNTIQRDLVLNAVRELKNHATAEEVYNRVSEDSPNVSRATVYRNLNVLAEEGSIRRIVIPGQADRYDHTTSEHYHARCIKCGGVFDVSMEPVPDITSHIDDAGGFVFLGCDIIFKGICPKCDHNGGKNHGKQVHRNTDRKES